MNSLLNRKLVKANHGGVENHLPNFGKDTSQALKGVAIIMMMLHHNFRETSLYENFQISFFPFWEADVVRVAFACKMCVSLFAFISGYGLYLSFNRKRGTVGQWTLERYIRTFSGYWFIWIVSAIVTQIIDARFLNIFLKKGIWQGSIEAIIDFLGLATLFGSGTLNGTWWYMSAAFSFIIIIALVYEKLHDRPWPVLIGSIVLIRVLFAGHADTAFTGGNSVYAFLSIFLMGAVSASHNLVDRWLAVGRGSKGKIIWKGILEASILIVVFKAFSYININRFWELHYSVFAVVVILFCVEFVTIIPGLRQILMFLGKHSMNIFCVHTFIRYNYLHDFTYSWKHFALVIIVLTLDSLLISLILEWLKRVSGYNRLIEKMCSKIYD